MIAAGARLVALRMLEAAGCLRPPPAPLFRLADFQRDAAARAADVLARRGGVLLADGVGLGKTYVALALAERELRAGGSVLVTAPASLRGEWVRPLRRLARASDVRRAIGLEIAPPARTAWPLLAWLSHARLSRGTHGPERLRPLSLVIVDEAHAFRTPVTRRYRALAELCRGARVMLVTATPVNNSLADLYFMIRLFAGDADFADAGVPDLRVLLRTNSDEAARAAARVLEIVAVRRTRATLEARYGVVALPGGERFPRRAPPVAVRYATDASLFARLLELERLTLAPFRLAEYGAPFASRPAGAELLRMVLLKRLESGAAAFAATVRRQLRYFDAFLEALGNERLLTARDHVALQRTIAGDTQLVLDSLVLGPLPAGVDCARLRADTHDDIARLRALAACAQPERDAKVARLEVLLRDELSGERTIVFTEFRDTAHALWRRLAAQQRVALIAGDVAYLGRGRATRRLVIERFAPRANRAREPSPRERVDVLIATDVLAEGLNLQDARCVVSYDLPWNPVRLMQRVGRVDRLGSPHDDVRSCVFLPADGLDELLGLMRRLRRKLHAIGASVGLDASVLGTAGDPQPELTVERFANGDAGALEHVERTAVADDRDDAHAELRRWCAMHTAHIDAHRENARINGAPLAGVLHAPHAQQQILLQLRQNDVVRWLTFDPSNGTAAILDRAPAGLLLHALRDDSGGAAGPSPDLLRTALRAASGALRQDAAPRAAASAPVAAAAHRLLRALSSLPGGPDPALARRADQLLGRLSRGVAIGEELALRGLLPSSAHSAAELVSQMESILETSPDDGVQPVLVAALEVRPAR